MWIATVLVTDLAGRLEKCGLEIILKVGHSASNSVNLLKIQSPT